MSLWTNLSGGLRALFHRRESEREMDEELRAYLDATVEQKVRGGESMRPRRSGRRGWRWAAWNR